MELSDRLAAGDPTALAEAYDCHASAVYGVARRILGNPAAAEDIAHDVFLRLWEQPWDFDLRRGRLVTWLCAMARYRAIDRLRRAQVQARYLPILAVGLPIPIDPAQETVRDVVAKTVRGAIDELPEPHRVAVLLAYYRGLSYQQVAVALGIAEGTAMSRLRLALRRLAERLTAAGLMD